MATRAWICIKDDHKDLWKCVYCHFDGFPSHTGRLLLSTYNTRKKIEDLQSHGSIFDLYGKIDPDPKLPHSGKDPQKDVTIFYGRDMGRDMAEVSPFFFTQYPDIFSSAYRAGYSPDFIYIFQDGKWMYSYLEGELGYDTDLRDLTYDTKD
jgi:hypothetical protein